MATNRLVIGGVVGLAAVALVISINFFNAEPDARNAAPLPRVDTAAAPLPPPAVQQPELVVGDGDTVSETLREMTAQYRATIDRIESVERENAELKQSLERQAESPSGASGTEQAARGGETGKVLQDVTENVARIQREVRQMADQILVRDRKNRAAGNGYQVTDTDLGWGDESTVGTADGAGSTGGDGAGLPLGYVTVATLKNKAAALADRVGTELDQAAGAARGGKGPTDIVNTLAEAKGGEKVEPRYTIPRRATLADAVAMSALIGVVPVGGKLSDPFPVKIILGGENLASNGYQIPGLEGIVFEGVARGNWVASCVSVTLTGATYTFADGRIEYLERDGAQGGTQQQTGGSPFAGSERQQGIGYISNPQGVPCIPGRQMTDAGRQLATVGLLGAGRNHFNAKAAIETTRSVVSGPLGSGGSSVVTGDTGAFVNNSTVADSLDTVLEFYRQRMPDTFDAIYVEPGAKIVLNIEQELAIDYDPGARKLFYSEESHYANALD